MTSPEDSELRDEKAEVLAPRVHGPTLGWLATGLVLVALLAAGIAWGLGKLREEPSPGRLLYAGKGGVFEHDLASGQEKRLAKLAGATVASVSPVGRWISYLAEDGRLMLTDLPPRELEIVVAERLTVPLGWTNDN